MKKDLKHVTKAELAAKVEELTEQVARLNTAVGESHHREERLDAELQAKRREVDRTFRALADMEEELARVRKSLREEVTHTQELEEFATTVVAMLARVNSPELFFRVLTGVAGRLGFDAEKMREAALPCIRKGYVAAVDFKAETFDAEKGAKEIAELFKKLEALGAIFYGDNSDCEARKARA